MSPLFVGQRGSMNYAFNHVDDGLSKNYLVQRYNEPFTTTGIGLTFNTFVSTTMPNAIDPYYGGITGQALENEATQTGLQFSVPFMNKFRFCSTSPIDRANGADYDDSRITILLFQPQQCTKLSLAKLSKWEVRSLNTTLLVWITRHCGFLVPQNGGSTILVQYRLTSLQNILDIKMSPLIGGAT
jgi:hypothetical protein